MQCIAFCNFGYMCEKELSGKAGTFFPCKSNVCGACGVFDCVCMCGVRGVCVVCVRFVCGVPVCAVCGFRACVCGAWYVMCGDVCVCACVRCV